MQGPWGVNANAVYGYTDLKSKHIFCTFLIARPVLATETNMGNVSKVQPGCKFAATRDHVQFSLISPAPNIAPGKGQAPE